METSFLKKTVTSVIISGALLLSACSKKANDAEGAIPDSPDAAVQTIISEFAKGNGKIIWSALPTSYQSDVNDLMHLVGSKTEKEVYDKSFSLFARLADIIEQQKAFIANSELIKKGPGEEPAQVEAKLPALAGFMKTIATSELSSTEGLRDFNGEVFFDTTVSECIEYLDALGQLSVDGVKLEDYTNTVVSVIDSEGQQATLLIAVPGQEAQKVVFTKVENRWVPAEMESDWAMNFEKMTAALKAKSSEQTEAQKTQVMGALTIIEGILTKIETAKTQEQFDESLKSAVLPAMSIFMMLSQAVGATDEP